MASVPYMVLTPFPVLGNCGIIAYFRADKFERMAKQNKRGLGRGLGNILGPEIQKEEVQQTVNISEIPVKEISKNRYQPRTEFDEDALNELSSSIKVHGIIQPITVRRLEEGSYELISGERRWRASQMAGLKKIPAYIRTANDEELAEMALIENIHRQDLNPIEIAVSYQRLISEHSLKQEELEKKVGKNRTSISNYLRLLKLPAAVQKGLQEKSLSFGHARSLITIKDPGAMEDLYQMILEKNLSVRQTEILAKDLKNPKKEEKTPEKKAQPDRHQIHVSDMERKLENIFGSKIKLTQNPSSGQGEIRVKFSNNEDLERILEIMGL